MKKGEIMEKAVVNNITRLRIGTDGAGVRSVIFFQGCPLNCQWCCNPETRIPGQGKELTSEQLFHYIRRDVPYFLASGGGVTFSGGEPLLWTPFLREFIGLFCEGYTVDMETSLQARESEVRSLIPLIHLWNVDFKLADPERHREYTGKSNAQILKNLEILAREGSPERIVITYPIIPGVNDSEGNIEKMICFMHGLGLSQVELHPYRTEAKRKHRNAGMPPPEFQSVGREQMAKIRALFQEEGITSVCKESFWGKEKCAYLKELRQKLCREQNLPVEIAHCTRTEPCIGTCPRCEYELQQIGTLMNQRKGVCNV